MSKKYTPDFIRSLASNQVFVFGSNTEGRHGKGAAKDALRWGAQYGNPRGLQGQTYAICTKDLSKGKRSYPLEEIEKEIDTFLEFVRNNPGTEFLVTKIGTGEGGYTFKQISNLFVGKVIPNNVFLPREFWYLIDEANELKAVMANDPQREESLVKLKVTMPKDIKARKKPGQNLINRLLKQYMFNNLLCDYTGLKSLEDEIISLDENHKEVLYDFMSDEWHDCLNRNLAVDILQILWDIGEIPAIEVYYQDNALEGLLYNPKMLWAEYRGLIDFGTFDPTHSFLCWQEIQPRKGEIIKLNELEGYLEQLVDNLSKEDRKLLHPNDMIIVKERFDRDIKPLLLGLGLVEPNRAIAEIVQIIDREEVEVVDKDVPWEPFPDMPNGVLGYSTLPFLNKED